MGEAVSAAMTKDLLDQFRRAIAMLRFTIEELTARSGLQALPGSILPLGWHYT